MCRCTPHWAFEPLIDPPSCVHFGKFLKKGLAGEDDWSRSLLSICQSCSSRNVGATFLLPSLVQFLTVSITVQAICSLTLTPLAYRTSCATRCRPKRLGCLFPAVFLHKQLRVVSLITSDLLPETRYQRVHLLCTCFAGRDQV